jgi:hypothetical protein
MSSPRERSPRHRAGRRWALWAGLTVGSLIPTAGCQVEYAGMTLPSGKYMHDDVQYFPSGPDFPWANTQAAALRARASVAGQELGLPAMPAPPAGGAVATPPPAAGGLAPVQNIPGRETDVNVIPVPPPPPPAPGGAEAAPGAPPAPGAVPPPPGAEVPPPPGGAAPETAPK